MVLLKVDRNTKRADVFKKLQDEVNLIGEQRNEVFLLW